MNTNIFEKMQEGDYEQITFYYDKSTGLKAINCIHSTEIGPAGGGTRMLPYETEDAALEDVLKLSRAMTYKAALCGVDMGGGKTVIIADPKDVRKDLVTEEAFFRSYGRFIKGFHGRYWPGTDINTSSYDLMIAYRECQDVMAVPGTAEGNGHIATAWGVFRGMQACCQFVYGDPSVKGKKIAIQGVGGCGWLIAEYLHKEGAELIVCDVDQARVQKAVEEFGAKAVSVDEIYDVECDIFSPNALGGILNDDTIPRLNCKIVCGAANNILLDEQKHGKAMEDRGIVCAPDFVVNPGGIIFDGLNNVFGGLYAQRIMDETDKTYQRTLEVLEKAKADGKLPIEMAYEMAQARIDALKSIHQTYTGKD